MRGSRDGHSPCPARARAVGASGAVGLRGGAGNLRGFVAGVARRGASEGGERFPGEPAERGPGAPAWGRLCPAGDVPRRQTCFACKRGKGGKKTPNPRGPGRPLCR